MTMRRVAEGDPTELSRRRFLEAASLLSLAGLTGCRSEPASDAASATAAMPTGGELPDELWRAGAKQLADAIARGDVSSLEVVEAHLTRIDEVNPAVNAIVRVLREEALAGARAADAAVADGDPLGPLHGVPFTIKENIDIVGSATTEGVKALAENLPERDAPVVERMKAAGAVALARTNLPDFGMRVHTESFLHGTTLNPWDPSRNVGGSSGGEGAALATGMSPIGLGNDIGGSLRNPAHCCGIASLKPSLGRVPKSGAEGGGLLAGQMMSVEGPMARHVADVRLGYEILAGWHARDPWSVPVPLFIESPPGPLRVALVPEPEGAATHPSVAAGVRRAGEVLQANGYEVEEVQPPLLMEAFEVWGTFITTDFQLVLEDMMGMMSPNARRFMELATEAMPPTDLAGYSGLLSRRHALAAAWQEFLSRYPLIVGPVFTQPPFEVGYDIAGAAQAADVLQQLRLVVSANLFGLPAAVVPVGTADGLPQVVEIIGDRYRETLCLDAAQVIEEQLGTLTPIDPRGA